MTWTDKVVKILLVDTNETNYIYIQNGLKEIKGTEFELDWIATFHAGLAIISHNQYDVYLIDYQLEDNHTGTELIQKAVKQGCSAPLILLTDHGNRKFDLEGMKAGAVDYLSTEQITPNLLERSIRYAITHKHAEAQLQQSRDELEDRITERSAEYAKINQVLQDKLSELEQLKQQTQISLEWRTRQVETSTHVAQEIVLAPAPDTLFRLVVNLVQERFGYYHAHVYTLDGKHLVMQEGTGEVGRMLKEISHKIPLNASRSLVAKAARNGEPVLVPDVSLDKRWLPNLLLKQTKSELAVPIKLRNQILGVLDVQHDKIGGLSREDQILMMGLCGQIAVAINNQRLEAERKQAQESQKKLIEELDAFGHTAGHTIKDPLGLIVGYTALLKEQARLPEELQGYLNAIARNSQRINNIIEELQLLTGVRKETVELKPLNMIRIIAEVQQRLAYLIEKHNAKIIISEYWPVAWGHTPWIEEVWANYISNAIKHGGNPPRVHLGATAQSDGKVRFWVKDNGPGLTKQKQVKLFADLARLGPTVPKGYGLGLSIVKRIVDKLGGEVGVTSDGIDGQGCIFTFTLPSSPKTKLAAGA